MLKLFKNNDWVAPMDIGGGIGDPDISYSDFSVGDKS